MKFKHAFWALFFLSFSPMPLAASPTRMPGNRIGFSSGSGRARAAASLAKGRDKSLFAWDLQEKVLVRRNRAEYPAAQGRPAVLHEDLMVIYLADQSGPTRAIYFDSEGHVINYAASISEDGRTLTFLSDAAGQPSVSIVLFQGQG